MIPSLQFFFMYSCLLLLLLPSLLHSFLHSLLLAIPTPHSHFFLVTSSLTFPSLLFLFSLPFPNHSNLLFLTPSFLQSFFHYSLPFNLQLHSYILFFPRSLLHSFSSFNIPKSPLPSFTIPTVLLLLPSLLHLLLPSPPCPPYFTFKDTYNNWGIKLR